MYHNLRNNNNIPQSIDNFKKKTPGFLNELQLISFSY